MPFGFSPMFAVSTRRWLPAALQLRRLSVAAPLSPLGTALPKERIIHNKLTERFSPSELQIEDVSGGCGTFFAITITSDAFKGLPMVKQHKLVTQTLKEEISDIHGVQIKTKS
ncbi:bola-like protein [Mycena belliarum]|uniref:Bola-like protein n=1 Tax=Mycena belliarum TaxID=1033014 RepID=A0AAD6XXC8_9AGAR|nr:bola-like protein [Mycena belliae]